jgi:aspartyl-tRNA(Asn)/glutamyl-tRNA(Gln) amidotransferase subunit C
MTNPSSKPQRLTEDEVRRVATLCRIGLTDDEVERLRDEMPGLIAEVSVLQNFDTSSVEPTGHAVEGVHTVMRDDTPRPAMTVEETLSNAPRREGNYFRVAQVMDDGQG